MTQSTKPPKDTSLPKDTPQYKDMMVKYNLHHSEAVALEALAAATPLLMMKLKTEAVATYVGAIIFGIGKDDKEKVRELHMAYDEIIHRVYNTLGKTLTVGIIAIIEEADKDEDIKPSDLH